MSGIGTTLAVCQRAELLDEHGQLPRFRQVLGSGCAATRVSQWFRKCNHRGDTSDCVVNLKFGARIDFTQRGRAIQSG